MSDFLHKVKRLSDAALDLYSKAVHGKVSVLKDDLREIVNDWRRLDSAHRLERLKSIQLNSEIEELRDLLSRSKEWIAASEEQVLKVAVDVFGGVIGDSSERLLTYSPKLLEDIRTAISSPENPS